MKYSIMESSENSQKSSTALYVIVSYRRCFNYFYISEQDTKELSLIESKGMDKLTQADLQEIYTSMIKKWR